MEAYESIGIFNANIVYIYSDFRVFGNYLKDFSDRESFFKSFTDPLLRRDKTIILTTFTYTTHGKFDTLSTFPKIGALNKWILNQSGVVRSEHPLFSYAALGPDAKIVKNIGKSAFGKDSIFDRLLMNDAAFLYLGRPIKYGNTLIHYIEQLGGATYRINKAFKTDVFCGNKYIGNNYSAFLRRRDVEQRAFEFNFDKAAKKLHQKGMVTQFGSEKSFNNISYLNYDETVDLLFDNFTKDPSIFIKDQFIQY